MSDKLYLVFIHLFVLVETGVIFEVHYQIASEVLHVEVHVAVFNDIWMVESVNELKVALQEDDMLLVHLH